MVRHTIMGFLPALAAVSQALIAPISSLGGSDPSIAEARDVLSKRDDLGDGKLNCRAMQPAYRYLFSNPGQGEEGILRDKLRELGEKTSKPSPGNCYVQRLHREPDPKKKQIYAAVYVCDEDKLGSTGPNGDYLAKVLDRIDRDCKVCGDVWAGGSWYPSHNEWSVWVGTGCPKSYGDITSSGGYFGQPSKYEWDIGDADKCKKDTEVKMPECPKPVAGPECDVQNQGAC